MFKMTLNEIENRRFYLAWVLILALWLNQNLVYPAIGTHAGL